MQEREFVAKVAQLGGKVYLVGGAVRDQFRGTAAHDRDYCVAGLNEATFVRAFPEAYRSGRAFPVYRLDIGGTTSEVAFARRESKCGRGYRGFRVEFDPTVRIEQDLYRRDTTINAMAVDLVSRRLIDPFDGRGDISRKRIRAISEHFVEDPVRALRAARQAAQLEFEITGATYRLMSECSLELKAEPTERVFNELELALGVKRPSIFFRSLERAGLLAVAYPELWRLKGKTEPKEYHPEADAFEHTMNLLDTVSQNNPKVLVRFCALVHDIGKGATEPEMLPQHHGHESRGVCVLRGWNERMKMPRTWIKAGEFVIAEHMRAPRLKRPGKITELMLAIHSSGLSVRDFNSVIEADHGGLPIYLKRAEEILKECLKVRGNECPRGLKGAQIGAWIRERRIKIVQNMINRGEKNAWSSNAI